MADTELGYGRYFAIRQCGSSLAYCDGNCGACTGSRIETSDHVEPINLNCYYSNGVYIVGVEKPGAKDIGVANAKRIAEAVERTKKYLKE